MYETVLLDGTDIKVAGVRLLRVWQGALATPELRGDDLTVADADGDTEVGERPFGAFMLNLGLTLMGGTNAGFNDARRALTRLVKADSTVTLTRRLSLSSGNEEHTAPARYSSGLEPTQVYAMLDGDFTLAMKVLSGLWYGPTQTISTGTVAVLGDVRTRRMTVTFTGGTNPELSNATTGDAVSWTGAVGGTPVVVDNETITATRGGVGVSGLLNHTRTFPMTLAAGSNTLSVTGGGSVSIAYSPAYL